MSKVHKTIFTTTILLVFGVFLTGCVGNKNDQVLGLLNEGKYIKAIKTANKALEGEPADKKFIVYNRGRARMHLERYSKAIDDFQTALKLNQDNEWAKWPTYRIGRVNVKQGNYQEAIENFSSALSFERNWIKAIEARAEAKSKMGDEVAAEEDRQLVRQIKERRERKRRRKQIQKEREELMNAWKNLTKDAPFKDYGYEIGGLPGEKVWEVWPVFFHSGTTSCDLDSHRTRFEEVEKKMTELGGEKVKRENLEGSIFRVTWRFTWWFQSHPDIPFDYHLVYEFEDCSQREDGSDAVMVTYEQPVKDWGHIPRKYDPYIDYEENRKLFQAVRYPKWTEEWHMD